MASIEDVAKKAKVSVTTVSRMMNNHPYVSDKTKKRIQKAMEELSYFPNSGAQQLRGKGTKLIGVIVSYITNPFFSYLVASIEKTATEMGYHLIVLQTLQDIKREELFINMLKKKQLDGLISTSLETNTEEVCEMVRKGEIVLCNRSLIHQDLPIVQIDEAKISEEATLHLFERGYQKIAFCLGGETLHPTDNRFKGFMAAHLRQHQEFNQNFFFKNVKTIQQGRELFHMVSALTERPDALFANSDEVAAGFVDEAILHGWNIPQDMAVMGFDDQPIASLLTPKLTTIRQPIDEMGRQATLALLSHLENQEFEMPAPLRAELIIRSST
ncbi:transcriptional regulator [Streptococcus cuniculi]|uniref:Transcriptional regulator n=1 Tax=Streptococcus cuniculi TaxID=1432788 RepID=A0A1Q8E7H8_9STRE|nr:LacI family DNA-binding transcriptional regulator [Streptococcus cuniculi]OLF47737.1 transcriptional regulator [Streptococcus cuniculi]